ncbi:MAG: transcription antitermination factor NusB [Planctomycetota bacterium]
MSKRHDIRRLAMQVLYQIDATGETDAELIFAELDEDHDAPEVRTAAVEFALRAWEDHGTIDDRITAIAPDWPTHRQPPVDRAILRLAVHDMTSGRSPAKVAINEALELAKQFSHENAPPFINGILDKLHKTLELPPASAPPRTPSDSGGPAPDAWLDDAKAPPPDPTG